MSIDKKEIKRKSKEARDENFQILEHVFESFSKERKTNIKDAFYLGYMAAINKEELTKAIILAKKKEGKKCLKQ